MVIVRFRHYKLEGPVIEYGLDYVPQTNDFLEFEDGREGRVINRTCVLGPRGIRYYQITWSDL